MSNFSNGINNGSNTPVIYQTTDANRPTAPLALGSLFVSQTSNILQRWDGSGWVTVGGSGTGSVTSVNGQTGVVVLTTTDIAEGTNLYYTDARARAALSAGTGISYNSTTGAITNSGVLSFNGSTGAITYTAPVTSVNSQTGAVTLTTTNIAEGTNLYYTDGRARAALSGGTGVTYNSTTGVIAIGQSVATSATPVFAGVQSNSSSGLLINNSAGTLVATFGSAGTTNASVVGSFNVGSGVGASNFASSGAQFFSYTLNGRSSDNFGAFGFYSNNGATRYGYIQSGPTNGGQINITGDGGGQIILDNTGVLIPINLGLIIGANSRTFARQTIGGDAEIGAALGGDLYLFSRGSTAVSFSTGNSATFVSTVQATQFNGVLASGNSLAGTLTGTGTNVGAQWKFVSDNNTTGAFIGIAAGESTGDAVFAVGANKKLVFGVGSAGTSRAAELSGNSFKIFATAGNAANYVEIGSVAGTANTWLFGSYVTGASVSLSSSQYLNVTINGNAVKLAVVV